MMLQLRVVFSRLKQTTALIGLRLISLMLAALVAGSIPAFVTASMEQVLDKERKAMTEPLSIVLSWTSPDEEEHGEALQAVDTYLGRTLPRAAGLDDTVTLVILPSSGQRSVQQIQPDGRLRAAKRFLALSILPDGLAAVSGRLPTAGAPEVVMESDAMAKAGYLVGERLRVPLTSSTSGLATEVTLVGSVRLPEEGPLANLAGPVAGMLLTSEKFWAELAIPAGEQTWTIDLAKARLHTASLPDLADALQTLPLQTARLLPGVDVVTTPIAWVESFLDRMATTRQLLVVLLTPVFLLIIVFAFATAAAVINGRRVEIAVLRSRGLTPLGVLWFYAAEGLLLVAVAAVAALLLIPPAVRVMGLSAGFLQLVQRPPLPVTLTGQSVLYALGAAFFAEAVALLPLVRAARLTVATMRQEEQVRSPVLAALRVMAELGLVASMAYGTWRLLSTGSASDPLYLALPMLALAGAGVVLWRLLDLVMAGLARALNPILPPSLHLAFGLLRSQSGRYQGLWLMLVITAGLGIYGAAFARTLERDLAALAQYRVGSDLLVRPLWESEVLSVDADGNPVEVIYNEPPYSQIGNLPGAIQTAKVQVRRDVTLAAGTRNLGKLDLMAITPQEFGQVARFLPELTPRTPAAYLNLLAADEQALLISTEAAKRFSVKAGDRLKVKDNGVEVPVVVVDTVPFFPGRLPTGSEFLVGNLEYLQDALGLEPYDVWVRLEPDAALAPVVAALAERGARLLGLEDRRSALAAGRREPLRLALYATLSAGFVIAIIVMALTYLLNIGLTLQSRIKELGVLRAMGMSTRSVAISLYTEQLVMVGTAALIGLAVGNQAAATFVPILRQQPGEALLPLRVADVLGERRFLLIGFAAALGLGASVVALWVRRLSINQALRLGEDG